MFLESERNFEHVFVCVCENSLFNDTVNISPVVCSRWMNAILELVWNDNIF